MEHYRGRMALGGILVVLPLLVLGLGIIPTLGKWQLFRQQKMMAADLNMRQDRQQDKGEGWAGCGPVLSNGLILKRLEGILTENGVSVVGYTPRFIRNAGAWDLYSGELELGGGFIPLLKVVACLQEKQSESHIVSLCYRASHDVAKKEIQLRLTVFLQVIETTSVGFSRGK